MIKSRFDEIKSMIIENRKNKSKTIVDRKEFTLDNAEKLVEDIVSGKINKSEIIKRYNDIVDGINTIVKSRATKPRTKMVDIFKQLKETFVSRVTDDKIYDKTYNKSDYETDEQQPDTTDMPDLESEESAEQRKNERGQGLKILAPDQMLTRLPISLVQLKTRNNSEKLKNEIGQLLYSLYRSKKL